MFSALVSLGQDLEKQGKLPPPGFYHYAEPLRWVVHLWPNRVSLEAVESAIPRPFAGRTSGLQTHLLTDEGGYALGVVKDKGGKIDARSSKKHAEFRGLLSRFLAWDGAIDQPLREAICWIETALDHEAIKADSRYNGILAKDWVSFMPEEGPLKGKHLFEHLEAKAFWIVEMQARCRPGKIGEEYEALGECSICGKQRPLMGRLPLGVKLAGNTPIHSLNADAFTSFISGAGSNKKAHVGLCFECGDTASRAFNYLSNSAQHRCDIIRANRKEDRDKLLNQTALFWLKAPAPLRIGERVLDFSELTSLDFGSVFTQGTANSQPPQATLSQLCDLLVLPWKPTDSSLRLDDYGFYLAILSPNVGRIALREWIAVSLAQLKASLEKFLDATHMVCLDGKQCRPHSIASMLAPLENNNPNHLRGLLRTAFTGTSPQRALGQLAAQRLRILYLGEASLRERQKAWKPGKPVLWCDQWLEALASMIKLSLFYGTEEVNRMSELNSARHTQAYLCGRLLAVLEEAQQVATYHKSKKRLDKTIVSRFYGSAASAPCATFGRLIQMASTAHLPEAGKEINVLTEEVMSNLDEAGGFPRTLSLGEQAEFGLGFYHQRANIRAGRP